MLRAIVTGKTATIAVDPGQQCGFKAAISRLATAQGIAVEVWSSPDGKLVCVRLQPAQSDAEGQG